MPWGWFWVRNLFKKDVPDTDVGEIPKKRVMLTAKQIVAKYGPPGPDNLISIDLPYPMRIAWDLKTSVKRIQCHKLIAPNLLRVFNELLAYYGYDKLKELGIDLFGGCYNYRAQRGGTGWSTHAVGAAIDLDPARNTLKETKKTARFARPEYKPMIDIFYKNGFIGLGPEEDRDWMHFQIAA